MGIPQLIEGGPEGGGGGEDEGPDKLLQASVSGPAFVFAGDADADEKTVVTPSLSSLDIQRLSRPAPRPSVQSVKVPMPAAMPSRRSSKPAARLGTAPKQAPRDDAHEASVDIDADTAFFDDAAQIAGVPSDPFAGTTSDSGDSGIGALGRAVEVDDAAGLDTGPTQAPVLGRAQQTVQRPRRRAQSPHLLPLAPPLPSPLPTASDVSVDPAAAYPSVAYQTAPPITGSYPTYTGTIPYLMPPVVAPAPPTAPSLAPRMIILLTFALLAAMGLGLAFGWLLFG